MTRTRARCSVQRRESAARRNDLLCNTVAAGVMNSVSIDILARGKS